MAKHGPWTSGHTAGYGSLKGVRVLDDRGLCVAVAIGDVPELQPTENARLIAAAPDLLDALKLCAGVVAGETMNKNGLVLALEAACAAIRKAESDHA